MNIEMCLLTMELNWYLWEFQQILGKSDFKGEGEKDFLRFHIFLLYGHIGHVLRHEAVTHAGTRNFTS